MVVDNCRRIPEVMVGIFVDCLGTEKKRKFGIVHVEYTSSLSTEHDFFRKFSQIFSVLQEKFSIFFERTFFETETDANAIY